ncbi:LysR family transcriptional regulator [Halioglobus japonicus]|uniref:LysR family transcriptional regulator n=1 Tax=Halioglobus japonicus TaxID=930805 RepID=A0AAP8MD55_9GAMM|nr:LysR substrate-binding domain-containing protein [Halioglobus japonicus]AQA17640.1 LysR family transcriptional regulator [Halioglobus japonicus]PLW85581.1 LysR family transcriptional regulator [Halioglobus japonicus]GHD16389.1 transcriptional regulator [Halioglobus japonicus]
MKYTLRQLQVFLATARLENISRAADTLAMSQSAASGSLKELEQQFDVQLFDRVGKRLQLSELGREIRPQAEKLLAQAQSLEAALAGAEIPGSLRLGATLTVGNYLTVPMIADFRERHAGADLSLHVANTSEIAAMVADFELDIGMIEGEVNHPRLQTRHWREDELQVFAAPGHPLAGKRRVSDAQLREQKWIVREPGSGTRQTFDRAMHGLLPDLEISIELQHTEAIKRAVEAGLGLGCLSRISLQEAFKRGSLVPVHVPQRDFRRQLNLIIHRDKFHGAALQQWLALCEQYSD